MTRFFLYIIQDGKRMYSHDYYIYTACPYIAYNAHLAIIANGSKARGVVNVKGQKIRYSAVWRRNMGRFKDLKQQFLYSKLA